MVNVGIFYSHLENITDIWYILWPFCWSSGNLVYFLLFWYIISTGNAERNSSFKIPFPLFGKSFFWISSFRSFELEVETSWIIYEVQLQTIFSDSFGTHSSKSKRRCLQRQTCVLYNFFLITEKSLSKKVSAKFKWIVNYHLFAFLQSKCQF
jgi:hypothetical protein